MADLFLGRPRSRRYPKFNIRRDIPLENRVHLTFFIAGARGAGILGVMFMPEFTSSVEILSRLYALHISVLPTLLFGFLGIHLFLIRFLDIHTYPGEEKNGRTFLNHLRKMFAHGFLFLAVAGLFSLVLPAHLGYPAVEGVEITKPPFFFLWIYALENLFGMKALVFGPPFLYLLLFLPPILDRKESTLPHDRKGILSVGFGFLLLLLALAIYAWLAPAQQHIM